MDAPVVGVSIDHMLGRSKDPDVVCVDAYSPQFLDVSHRSFCTWFAVFAFKILQCSNRFLFSRPQEFEIDRDELEEELPCRTSLGWELLYKLTTRACMCFECSAKWTSFRFVHLDSFDSWARADCFSKSSLKTFLLRNAVLQ